MKYRCKLAFPAWYNRPVNIHRVLHITKDELDLNFNIPDIPDVRLVNNLGNLTKYGVKNSKISILKKNIINYKKTINE